MLAIVLILVYLPFLKDSMVDSSSLKIWSCSFSEGELIPFESIVLEEKIDCGSKLDLLRQRRNAGVFKLCGTSES